MKNKLINQKWCVGQIAALLQAIGLSVGSCGLANVLQCAVAVARSVP
ncbi:MAG: hypothetical protein ACOYM7_12830 [Paludibacter sp.]